MLAMLDVFKILNLIDTEHCCAQEQKKNSKIFPTTNAHMIRP